MLLQCWGQNIFGTSYKFSDNYISKLKAYFSPFSFFLNLNLDLRIFSDGCHCSLNLFINHSLKKTSEVIWIIKSHSLKKFLLAPIVIVFYLFYLFYYYSSILWRKQQNVIKISLVKRKWKIFVEQKIMKSVHISVHLPEDFILGKCSAPWKFYILCVFCYC